MTSPPSTLHPPLSAPASPPGAARLAVVGGLLASGWGCGCPSAACGGTLDVLVRSDAWPAGTWTLHVGDNHQCTFEVRDGDSPWPNDVTCDEGVQRSTWLIDTGGTQDPKLVELTFPMPTPPESIVLTWTWSGSEQTWPSTVDIPWRDVTTRAGTCEEGCTAAHLELPVPTP